MDRKQMMQDANSWFSTIISASAGMEPPVTPSTGFIVAPSGKIYQVDKQVIATNDNFRLHRCTAPDGRFGILKIGTTADFNATMVREAILLQMMRRCALELEETNDLDVPINYQNFFPEVIDSFIPMPGDGRHINILGFTSSIESLSQLKVMSRLIHHDHLCVDPKTAAWILGKTLKTMAFAHSQGISIGFVSPSNLLLECEKHAVIVFDWSQAIRHNEGVPANIATKEVVSAAKGVLEILGANFSTSTLPSYEELPVEDQTKGDLFQKAIWDMANGRVATADEAYHLWYDGVIFPTWPKRDFHPFTTLTPTKGSR